MSKIKSKRAINYIKSLVITNFDIDATLVSVGKAKEAIIIAETEAEERHQKQLQELRDKITNLSICDIDAPVFTHTREFRSHFDYIKKCFTQKLTEKQ